jgi:hypothetical protein
MNGRASRQRASHFRSGLAIPYLHLGTDFSSFDAPCFLLSSNSSRRTTRRTTVLLNNNRDSSGLDLLSIDIG